MKVPAQDSIEEAGPPERGVGQVEDVATAWQEAAQNDPEYRDAINERCVPHAAYVVTLVGQHIMCTACTFVVPGLDADVLFWPHIKRPNQANARLTRSKGGGVARSDQTW